MKGPMKLIDATSGLMECRVCGSRHSANLQSGYLRADGITRYYRGSYQCSNERCPSNRKEWDESKKRYVKPDWRKLVKAAAV
jgi:hypothetical protein